MCEDPRDSNPLDPRDSEGRVVCLSVPATTFDALMAESTSLALVQELAQDATGRLDAHDFEGARAKLGEIAALFDRMRQSRIHGNRY